MLDSNAIIHIFNAALLRLGERPVSSTTETSAAANVCRELYPDVRDSLLSWHTWPWATVRLPLSRLVATPPSDYAYYYAMPTEPMHLRTIDISLDDEGFDYQHEIYVNPLTPEDQQHVLATDAESVVLRYIGRVSEAIWHPMAISAAGLWLAGSAAPSISGKASLRESIVFELMGRDGVSGVLGRLRDIAGHEDSPRRVPIPTTYRDVRG